MRKSPFWRLVGAILLEGILGTLAGQLLAHQIPLLGHTATVTWQSQADLAVIRYSLSFTLRVNWLTLIGVVVAIFIAQKRK